VVGVTEVVCCVTEVPPLSSSCLRRLLGAAEAAGDTARLCCRPGCWRRRAVAWQAAGERVWRWCDDGGLLKVRLLHGGGARVAGVCPMAPW
jgi:hypothetical protein